MDKTDLSFSKFFRQSQLDNLGDMSKMVQRGPNDMQVISVDEMIDKILLPGTRNMPDIPSNVPPQGEPAKMLVHSVEQLANVPDDILKIYLDSDGNLVPTWVQCARLFHRPRKKVAIVGFADTRNEAPFKDPSWEIWSINDLHNSIPRTDRHFDIHTLKNINEDVTAGRSPADRCGLEPLKRLNVPVYMQDRFTEYPNSVRFPIEEIIQAFPYGNYLTNSISMLIGLAILEDYKEIAVYGVDMAVDVEYTAQRPSVEYFMGIAAGRGIKLYVPPASDLMKTRFIYAYEDEQQDAFTQKIKSMLQHMQKRFYLPTL